MNFYISFIENINTIPVNNHYRKRLVRLLTALKELDDGNIKHHIVPLSWSFQYASKLDNLVRVNKKQHYVLHHLMWKAFPEDRKMAKAFKLISGEVKKKISWRSRILLSKLLGGYQRGNNHAKISSRITNR